MENKKVNDLLETAWSLICNAGGGDLSLQNKEWQKAFKKYRIKYFAHLKKENNPTP